MVSLAAVLWTFGILAPAHRDDDVEARLRRLEGRLAQLEEENRFLRERLEALGVASKPVGQKDAPSQTPPAAPSSSAVAQEDAIKVRVGGQVRVRPEYRNALEADAAGSHADAFVGERARLGVVVEARRVTAYVEVQDARAWGTEGSTVSNDRNLDLHQAYLRLPDLLRPGLSLTLGRQELAYGDERLLGALDWATTARSFDAGLLRYAWRSGSVDLFGALVSDRRTAQRGSGDLTLWGVYGRFLRASPRSELDAYVLGLHDGVRLSGEVSGEDTSRVTTVGLRGRHSPPEGLQASVEGAFQFGHRGPDDHEAFALALAAGYVFGGRLKPTLRIEWDAARGDGDTRDGRSREFNNLFPTNHVHYGYADLLGWRNMEALRGTLSMIPREGQQLSVDLHRFRLREARGAWKDAAGEVLGQDPTGDSGRAIGTELDLLYRLPLRKDVGLLLGYSAFFPGRFAEAFRGGRAQSFAYGQLLFRF